MRLEGKLVFVSGASSGIGAASARALARKGARVILIARNQGKLEHLAIEIRDNGGKAHVYPGDLADVKAVDALKAAIETDLGTPDVLVHCAGMGRWLFTEETSPEEMQQMMAVPYFATFYPTRAFLPAMLERGSGHIVIVNSPASYQPWAGATGYTAARWALRGFCEALRVDLSGTGIKVTSIVPAYVDSPYFDNNTGVRERFPTINRIVPDLSTEDVANGIVRGIELERGEVIMPLMLRVLLIFQRLFPRLTRWVIIKTGYKHPKRTS